MNNTNQSFSKFLLLWSGEFVSAIGSGLTSFGLGVYVYQQTGKASAMALVTLLAFMPSLLLSPFAGVLADRYDRRLLMILGDSLSALGLLFILFGVLSGSFELWQICVGVTVSSIFTSLLDPAYKATVTDLLTEEEYAKASGLVQIAGSAKYLISPLIAGFLLTVADISLILVIDICTVFVTIASTLAVRKGLPAKPSAKVHSFAAEFREGWHAITEKKGVFLLVIMTSVLTFFLGFIQTLFTPMILAFADSSALGTAETISASGMLVASVAIGILSIKKHYVKMLSVSLFFAGIFMALFGLRENMVIICASGFLFFAMLPFANTALDVLIRTNIGNEVQGRAWGLIGIISQLGYIISYALSGLLADFIFSPLMLEDGMLSGTIGRIIGTGTGRGAGLLIIVAGLLLSISSLLLYQIQSVRNLDLRRENKISPCEAAKMQATAAN